MPDTDQRPAPAARRAARRRRPPDSTPARADGLLHSVPEVAASYGYTLRTIDGTLCAVETDQAEQLVMAVVQLPGRNHYGGPAFGTVRRGQVDGSRWSVADTRGYMEHEFPTVEQALAALRDPATCQAMREYTELVWRMHDATRLVREFPPVAGALPNYWQPNISADRA